MKAAAYFGCGSAIVVATLASFVAFILPPYDDCMDNDLLASIRSEGKWLYLEEPAMPRSTMIHSTPVEGANDFQYHVNRLPSGNQRLFISADGKTESWTSRGFTSLAWSSKYRTLFFTAANLRKSDQSYPDRLWRWTAEVGMEPTDYYFDDLQELSLSQDQHTLVGLAGYYKGITATLISTDLKASAKVACPDGTISFAMTARDQYLIAVHPMGNYAKTYRWSKCRPIPEKVVSDEFGALSKPILDIASLDGAIWGLQHGQDGKLQAVRLDSHFNIVERSR